MVTGQGQGSQGSRSNKLPKQRQVGSHQRQVAYLFIFFIEPICATCTVGCCASLSIRLSLYDKILYIHIQTWPQLLYVAKLEIFGGITILLGLH